jgi:hypothetical protein
MGGEITEIVEVIMKSSKGNNVYSSQPKAAQVNKLAAPTEALLYRVNHFDAEGYSAGFSNEKLTGDQVSDIITHALQLTVVLGNISSGNEGIEAFDHVAAELNSALASCGIVDDISLPTLHLLKAS